jgi:hypothetical protein
MPKREREFLTPIPGQDVARAHLRSPRLGDIAQQPVAGLMTVCVVEALEVSTSSMATHSG